MTVDYNHQATKWHRDSSGPYGDFCGRPEIFNIIKTLGKEKTILDVGCGEGYFSRKIADISNHVVGVDLSREMIYLAVEREKQEKRGIKYHIGNAKDMSFLTDSTFDLCVGNYIANYFKPDELPQFYKELGRVIKDNGRFVLLMTHPVFELITDYGEAMQYEIDEYDYIKSRGKLFKAQLRTVQGNVLETGLYHSTLEDHFDAIAHAGLKVNKIKEPVFPQELSEKYPIFSKMGGKVVCMILVGEK